MKLPLTTFLAVALAAQVGSQAHAQEPVKLPAELKPFVLSGYEPFDVSSADLNRDGTVDYILVLQKKGDQEEGSRALLIITRGKDGTLKQVKRNDQIVLCAQCGGVMGDPFQSVEVAPGQFTLSHSGGSAWRWSSVVKFAYSRRDATWQLVRVEEDSFHTGDPEKTAKHEVFTPPKSFGKIDIADFEPGNFKGVGPR